MTTNHDALGGSTTYDWPQLLNDINNQPGTTVSFREYNRIISSINGASRLQQLSQQPLVPGNFQTPEYMHAIFENRNTDPEAYAPQTAFRLGRGALILESGARQDYIISESAIGETALGLFGQQVLLQQLVNLSLTAKSHEEVTIRILPETDTEPPVTDTVELFYAHPHSIGEGFVSSTSLGSLVQVTEPSIEALESTWAKAWEQALPAAESERRIDMAIARLG